MVRQNNERPKSNSIDPDFEAMTLKRGEQGLGAVAVTNGVKLAPYGRLYTGGRESEE